MHPTISLIAAISENRSIGNENKLLWHIPEDMQRFKSLTSGHTIIMGRKTYESIGRPLPNRTNIIITRDKNYSAPGCVITHSVEEAIKKASVDDNREIFVIGGGQIYQQAIKYANKLYLTIVKGNFAADTYFPDYSEFTTVIHKETGKSGQYSYTFLDLEPTQGTVCKMIMHDEFKKKLTPKQYNVCFLKGTEPPFSGKYNTNHAPGMYVCIACKQELFSSETKFDSDMGWPAFFDPVNNKHIRQQEDRSFGMVRTEVLCSNCGAHLGHLFTDGPKPTGKHYCINSQALDFKPS